MHDRYLLFVNCPSCITVIIIKTICFTDILSILMRRETNEEFEFH